MVIFDTQLDTGFRYLKVHFPDDFELLLNNEYCRSVQATNPAGYHITICDRRVYDSDAAAKEATDKLAEKDGEWQEIEMNSISISSGDTYQIEGDSEFAEDLRRKVAIKLSRQKNTPNYKAHISMD